MLCAGAREITKGSEVSRGLKEPMSHRIQVCSYLIKKCNLRFAQNWDHAQGSGGGSAKSKRVGTFEEGK